MSEALQWAQRYTARGWRTFPLHTASGGACSCPRGASCGKSAGKHPRISGWQKHATADPKQIAEWLEKFPGTNLGIATGGGLVVLDVDGNDGLDSLQQLFDQHGAFPTGPTQYTGSGGLHMLFRADRAIKNSVKILPGLDVRGDGGLIVVAPSVHLSGRQYMWQSFDLEVPALPEWLSDLMVGGAPLDFDFAAWLRRQGPAVAGQNGHGAAFRVAMQAVKAGRLRDFSAFRAAVDEWNRRCQPPWSDEDLEHKFDDALAKHVATGTIDVPINEKGKPICTRAVLHQILEEDPLYERTFQRNELTLALYHAGRELTETKVTAIEVEICKRYGFARIPKAEVESSIPLIAEAQSFNPITSYLGSLKWDGTPRLEHVPDRVLGADVEAQPILRQYVRRWAIGAVARAYKPGCKLDTALLLLGPQGIGKSTFFWILAGDQHFGDTEIDLKSKDGYLQVGTCWIYEWAELETVFRARDISRIKSFLSSRADNFRAPYARYNTRHDRRCVIVGTSNETEILHDPTGSRRFWAMLVTRVDRELLVSWRDQFWAEATHLYQAGEPWWLDEKEEKMRGEANEAHTAQSALSERAAEKIAEMELISGYSGAIKFNDVCAKLGVDPILISWTHQSQISAALKTSGYVSVKREENGKQFRAWVKRN